MKNGTAVTLCIAAVLSLQGEAFPQKACGTDHVGKEFCEFEDGVLADALSPRFNPLVFRCLQRNEFPEKARQCSTAVESGKLNDAETARVLEERAWALFQLGELDRAHSDLTKAIELQPKADLYEWRGKTRLFARRFDEAMDDFNEAVRIAPDNVKHYVARADAYLKMGDLHSVVQDLERADKVTTPRPEGRGF